VFVPSCFFSSSASFLLFVKDVDRQSTMDQLENLLPLAVQWAAEQERRVLCEGVRLSPTELADAKKIGVQNPERVRLLRVERIPVPAHPMLRAAAASINFLTAAPRGLALDYGIFVRADHWRDRELIAHELVHTKRSAGELEHDRQARRRRQRLHHLDRGGELMARAGSHPRHRHIHTCAFLH